MRAPAEGGNDAGGGAIEMTTEDENNNYDVICTFSYT